MIRLALNLSALRWFSCSQYFRHEHYSTFFLSRLDFWLFWHVCVQHSVQDVNSLSTLFAKGCATIWPACICLRLRVVLPECKEPHQCFFCSHLTHPHHYLATLAAPCPCSTMCANLKKSLVMVHETASIWYFLRLCVVFKLLVLKSTVQHAIATVYHPLAGQEQLQSSGRWYARKVSQTSSHPRVI